MTNLINQLKKNYQIVVITVALIFAAVLVFYSKPHQSKQSTNSEPAQEITQIKNTSNLLDQVKLYKQLIDRVGAAQAQEDLLRSGLPFTGQTHLLNHTVGEYLYKTKGVSGLSECKEYFLASCYHGFILDAIADGGIPQVVKVMQACKPQGAAVYPQCAHAVGHGFLTYIDYKNIPQALGMCEQMQQQISDFPLFNCEDGVFMENIWGVHDGEPSPNRWVKDSDHFYPCDDKRIESKYLLACWSNQPSLAYQQFHGDIAAVGKLCATVTPANLEEMCFNGLSRQIHPIAAGDIDKTFELCGLLDGKWKNYCIVINDQASFAVGDRSLPFAICSRIDASDKDRCFQGLIGMISVYAKSSDDRTQLCAQIADETWRQRCLGR